MVQKQVKGKDAEDFDGNPVVSDEIKERYLALATKPELQDPGKVQADIARRVLGADSVDDILGMGEGQALDAEEIAGRPFRIIGEPTWHESTLANQDATSPGVFVVMEIHLQDTDEKEVVTVGGSNVVAQVYRMHELGAFPLDTPMKFRAVKTGRGYTTLWLARADQ